MSGSDRYANATPWLVIILGLAFFGVATGNIAYLKGYQSANQDHESKHAKAAASKKHRDNCLSLPDLVQLKECFASENTADREQERAEQDLNAQREMANWAEGMLWASLLTAVITGVGVYLVARTLVATKETIKEAKAATLATEETVEITRDIGQRQLRAYVTLSEAKVDIKRVVDEGGFILNIVVSLVNSGSTPAYSFSTWIADPIISSVGSDPDKGAYRPIESRPGYSILGPKISAHISQTIPITKAQIELLENGRLKMFVSGGADYVDAFGQSRHFVFHCVNGPTQVDGRAQFFWGLQPRKWGYEAN